MSPTGKIHAQACDLWSLPALSGGRLVCLARLSGRQDGRVPETVARAARRQLRRIAEVYGEPVTANQLSRRITELKMLRQPPVLDMEGGIKLTHEPDIPGDLAPRARYDLIGSSLLRLKTSVNDLQLPNRNAEAARAVEQIRSRFDGDTEQYLKTLHGQKLTQEQFQKK